MTYGTWEATRYNADTRLGSRAGRDAIEFILKARGILEQAIAPYRDERNPLAAKMDIGKGGL